VPGELTARTAVDNETRAMLARLGRIKPFALHETMVTAAMPSRAAQTAIERHLADGRLVLREQIGAFRRWLQADGKDADPERIQRRFVILRLRFNAVLSDFDEFADVLTQRSEHATGPWLAGLDVVAADALRLDAVPVEAPPVICYLDRGHGAAIRRARTRLPGGGENPVAIIRVPRERMIGSGIASSLVHEVGHQAAALLDLNNSLRLALKQHQPSGEDAAAWATWERWISEIVADLWALARIGVASTTGLMTIVSLPRAFVFRLQPEDPHPVPWMRVRLSCAMGHALYPDPQWHRLAALWDSLYPAAGVPEGSRALLTSLERTLPAFVRLLLAHRPSSFGGRALVEGLRSGDREPAALRARFGSWRDRFRVMRAEAPALVFAVLGQARIDGAITPERESRLLGDLLTYWALRQALQTTEFATVRTSTIRDLAASA
jgi:hypothetical protein